MPVLAADEHLPLVSRDHLSANASSLAVVFDCLDLDTCCHPLATRRSGSQGSSMKTAPTRNEQIVALYKQGLRPIVIAPKVGVSRQRVHQVLSNTCVDYVPRAVEVAARREQVKFLYVGGAGPTKIAADLELPLKLIKNDLMLLEIAGARLEEITKRRDARRESVRALHNEGMTLVEIASQLDVPIRRIRNDAKALSLPLRARATPDEVVERRAKVAALRSKGYGLRDIGQRLGLPYSTIQGYAQPRRTL